MLRIKYYQKQAYLLDVPAKYFLVYTRHWQERSRAYLQHLQQCNTSV